MRSPIKSFENIKSDFIRYVDTAFHIADEKSREEYMDLLKREGTLCRDPYIEPLPEYQPFIDKNTGEPVKFKDITKAHLGLTNEISDVAFNNFKELVKQGLFNGDYTPHQHQMDMLRTALKGNNCIITSGTGSGKTESFLFPLFAQLSREMETWGGGETLRSRCPWLDVQLTKNGEVKASEADRISSNYDSVAQRPYNNSGGHEPAVRALLLYPMNALVEDQIRRLREALDSHYPELDSDAVSFFQNQGKHIFFGRYNGDTPVAGKLEKPDFTPNKTKINNLYNSIKGIHKNYEEVTTYVNTEILANIQNLTPQDQKKAYEKAKDHLSFFPRLNGTEMYSRQDMQLAPPDIFITNFSMLSIMLMRDVDMNIWDQTRSWLQGDPNRDTNPTRIFHLVLDELHLYRGTSGTEVAYLLRLLLRKLDLTPNHPQLRILASSASLEATDPASVKYLEDFYGIDKNDNAFPKIITGTAVAVPAVQNNVCLNPQLFVDFAEAYYHYCSSTDDNREAIFAQKAEDIAKQMANLYGANINTDVGGIERLLEVCLSDRIELKPRLMAAFNVNNTTRAVSSYGENDIDYGNPSLAVALFGQQEKDVLEKALDGIFILRAYLTEIVNQHKNNQTHCNLSDSALPRFRNHLFFKNLDGIWASTDTTEVDAKYQSNERTIGKLYPKPKDISEQGNRVLEMLYCESCGSVFYGGYRSKVNVNNPLQRLQQSNEYILLPNIVDLDKIPGKAISRWVEDRTYKEYAVFWPKGNNEKVDGADEKANDLQQWNFQPKKDGSVNPQAGVSAAWERASLNPKSGAVKLTTNAQPNGVDGYLFVMRNNNRDLADVDEKYYRALPCVCPCCGSTSLPTHGDGFTKKRSSPIRAMGTGFGKASQMICDYLLDELSDRTKQITIDDEKRKLVVFSDSREAAAQISLGIEENHYKETFRESLAKLVRMQNPNAQALKKKLEAVESGQNINFADPDIMKIITARQSLAFGNNTPNPLLNNLTPQEFIDNIRNCDVKPIKLHDLVVSTTGDLTPFVATFVENGINPAGEFNTYWQNNYRYNNGVWNWEVNVDKNIIHEKIFKKIGALSTGNLYFSLEASGLGYYCVDKAQLGATLTNGNLFLNDVDRIYDIANGCIRVWIGIRKYCPCEENYPHQNNVDYALPQNWPAKVRRWISNVALHNGFNDNQLLNTIAQVFRDQQILDKDYGVKIENLQLYVVNGNEKVYWNSRIKIPHLHKCGGICTTAGRNRQYDRFSPDTTTLIDSGFTVKDIWKDNYLSYNAMVRKVEPVRLHCEEMTGQTDTPFERQRYFRNIILGDKKEKVVNTIDLLSVTTTLEVGVDIGALQAVMLADMPPQRFNYQQRVGRAGRRGQPFSFVLTFCKGQSHDEFYYNHPMKITGDPSPTPFLSMSEDNLEIAKRMINKALLCEAFASFRDSNMDECVDVHGEFGTISYHDANNNVIENMWSDNTLGALNYKSKTTSWIVNNRAKIDEIINGLVNGDQQMYSLLVQDYTIANGTCPFIEKVDKILSDKSLIATENIAQRLAEGGVMPLYGMPTNIKELYLGKTDNGNSSISRSDEMAIYEFAPGCQKTKDKKKYTSVGFASAAMRGALPYMSTYMYQCEKCKRLIVEDDLNNIVNLSNCQCGETIDQNGIKTIVLPFAYTTNRRYDETHDGSYVVTGKAPAISESSNSNSSTQKVVKNTNVSLALQNKVWRINDNNGSQFKGNDYQLDGSYVWVANGMQINNQQQIQQNAPVGLVGNRDISLGSNKITNLVRFSIASQPNDINTDMFDGDLKDGIKSAFYSAAYIIQRTLAEKTDVDPQEIEIATIQKTILPNTNKATAEIIMNDQLVNGSGFVKLLNDSVLESILSDVKKTSANISLEFLKNLTSDDHALRCTTACYDCLRVYRNMSFHPILDWRLGLSILKIMSDRLYTCGANGVFFGADLKYPHGTWLDYTKSLAESFNDNYVHGSVCNSQGNNGGLWYIKLGNKIIVFTHPLWNIDISDNTLNNWAINNIRNLCAGRQSSDIKFIDTFNLERRMAWCYQLVLN